jgi:hypothetical protein
VAASDPILWVHPSRLTSTSERPTRGRLLTRVGRFLGPGTIEVTQAGRALHAAYHRRLVPNRSISVAAASLASADLGGGPVALAWHAGR